VNLRRLAFWGAGILVVAVILVLLIWPELAGNITMGLVLLAAALGILRGVRRDGKRSNVSSSGAIRKSASVTSLGWRLLPR